MGENNRDSAIKTNIIDASHMCNNQWTTYIKTILATIQPNPLKPTQFLLIITYHTIIFFKWTKATNRQAKSELKEAKAVLGPQSPLVRTFQFGMIDKQKFYFDHQKIILHMSYWTNWISLLWFTYQKKNFFALVPPSKVS